MEVFPLEFDLLHTKIFQRLYFIKQLGLSDKVFPDAVHSRFNHSLGTVERADKIIKSSVASLEELKESNKEGEAKKFFYQGGSITLAELISEVKQNVPVARLMAFLHDLTHIPFGHTLEDEIQLFSLKHDDPERQVEFFNAITRELLVNYSLKIDSNLDEAVFLICRDPFSPQEDERLLHFWETTLEGLFTKYEAPFEEELKAFLSNLRSAMQVLLYSEHYLSKFQAVSEYAPPELLIDRALAVAGIEYREIDILRESYLLDIIKNTICADLLDYSRRDHAFAGMKYDYDDRIFKYFTIVSYRPLDSKGEDDTTYPQMLRLSLMLFTRKIRYDVVSEIITILRNRYLETERIIFHPTKCSGGAMMGLAAELVALPPIPHMYYQLGEEGLLIYFQDYCFSLFRLVKYIEENNLIAHEFLNAQIMGLSENPEFPFIENLCAVLNESIGKDLEGRLADQFLKNNLEYLTRSLGKAFLETTRFIVDQLDPDKLKLFNEEESQQALSEIFSRAYYRFNAARIVIYQNRSRLYFKKVFRISSIDWNNKEAILATLSRHFKDPQSRFNFERELEQRCDLPYGSIVIHSPVRDTTLKESKVLVFGSVSSEVSPFNEISEKADHTLNTLMPYLDEAKNLEQMYKAIWNLYIFVRESELDKWPFIEKIAENMLTDVYSSQSSGNDKIPIANNSALHQELQQIPRTTAKFYSDVVEASESEKVIAHPTINRDFIRAAETYVTSDLRNKNPKPVEFVKTYLKENISPKKTRKSPKPKKIDAKE